MSVHVLEEKAFFNASVPIADGQRLVLLPGPRPVSTGDELYLRGSNGEITWVADVLMARATGGAQAWSDSASETEQPYVIAGWLARVHPDTIPTGRAHLSAPWVTLNSRTLATALPWRENGRLVYHHTLRLVEGVVTEEEFQLAQSLGIVLQHRSGHWFFPMGDARKRFLVQVRSEPLVCALCGSAIASIEECTQDHRIPSSQGGPDMLGNLQLAHKFCNELKGNALPEQYPPIFNPPAEDQRYNPRRPYHKQGRNQRGSAANLLLASLTSAATAAAGLVQPASATNGHSGPTPNGMAAAMAAANVAAGVNGDAANGAVSQASALSVAMPTAPAKTAPAKTDSVKTGSVAAAAETSGAQELVAVAAEAGEKAAPAKKAKKTTRGKKATAKSAGEEAAGTKSADTKSADAKATETKSAGAKATNNAKVKSPAQPSSAETESGSPAADAPPGSPVAPAAASGPAVASAPAAVSASAVGLDGLSAPEEWLHQVQQAGWQELAAMAASADWAARTATLRTMCALRQTKAQKAAEEGVLVAEARGKEGHFRFVSWKDQQILVEEKNGKRHVHQVHMLAGLAPEVYVWYVSEFGRTAPLSVAMALLPLWQSATPDGEGRVIAKKGSLKLALKVVENRLMDCARHPSAVA